MEKIYELVAQRIRDEMVCCPTYDKIEAVGFAEADYRALKRESNYHAICHYGEWAARVVETMGAEDQREAYRPIGEGCPPDCQTDPKIRTGHYEPR